MRSSLRSAAPRFLAAAVGALALAVSAAGSAQAATTGSTSKCQWHKLTLIHGWRSEQSRWKTGDPAYCVDGNGIVYLAGATAQRIGGSPEFAVLPKAARPASDLYIATYTYNGSIGFLQVMTDGEVTANDGKGNVGLAQRFTSLAGLSFPTAATANSGHAIAPLLNGWESAQFPYLTGDPSYVVKGGVAHLSGSVKNRDGDSFEGNQVLISHLPKAARPTDCLQTFVYTYGGGTNVLSASPSIGGGGLWGSEGDFMSLAGLSYPVGRVTWHALPSSLGANPYACLPPAYEVSRGVVYLTGTWEISGTGTLAVLPPGARPAHSLYLAIGGNGAPGAAYSVIRIEPNGDIWTVGNLAQRMLSLEGVSFRVGA